MTLKKYEQVVGVMVKPAGICTLEGLSALNGVTLLLPSTTTLYEAAEVDAELSTLRQQLAEARQQVWEEAANKIEHERNTDCNYYDAMTRAYLWCRERAETTPMKPWASP